MKNNILVTLFLAIPLAAVAGRICIANPIPQFCASCPEVCVETDKFFELCPYEDCVDECTSGSMASPCNPMDLCDPGFGCALGCAVACR